MSLKEYVAALETLIAATPFVAATSLSYEERPPTAGLIKGAIVFTDGSTRFQGIPHYPANNTRDQICL